MKKYYVAQLYCKDHIKHSSSGTMDIPADYCWDLEGKGLLDATAGRALFATREDAERMAEESVVAFGNNAYYEVVELTEDEAKASYGL